MNEYSTTGSRIAAVVTVGLMGLVMAGTLVTAPAHASTRPAEAVPTPAVSTDSGTLTLGENASGTAQSCRAYLGKPYKASGPRVKALTYVRDCTWRWYFKARLQRSRWYGWETMDEREWRGNATHMLSTDCAGTHTYRLWMRIDNPRGDVKIITGREARLNCG
ncbi:hypothetical protein CDO52_06780 [Nocardiopsis gilva YIM 90087]|uniref:DUF2690 domain-containing protein n=1 Tax=Nocardiopsis gilva YIM 90087 TaxID=1235441 RepID=A0A223S317_9ACTN|nr:hypothetical protein [Nocardiopsis gilva]ASU82526.1 hypothetical protein CDO52_06780 [Nocardiopsis gilva YIM 90087]